MFVLDRLLPSVYELPAQLRGKVLAKILNQWPILGTGPTERN